MLIQFVLIGIYVVVVARFSLSLVRADFLVLCVDPKIANITHLHTNTHIHTLYSPIFHHTILTMNILCGKIRVKAQERKEFNKKRKMNKKNTRSIRNKTKYTLCISVRVKIFNILGIEILKMINDTGGSGIILREFICYSTYSYICS